jgi:hypothetical protein
MKIEHVTYDQTHARRSRMRRASDAPIIIKNYISARFSRHLDVDLSSTGKPTTFWPQFGKETVGDQESEMTAYLIQHHRVEKATRKDEEITVDANHSGNYLPLRDTDRGVAPDDAPFPILRRKAKFIKEKQNIKSINSRPHTTDGKIDIQKLHKLQQAMKEGRLEQVVPSSQPSRTEGRLFLPPNRLQNRFADPSPRVSAEFSRECSSSLHGTPSLTRHSSRRGKTKSSSRVKDYIRTSVDTMDEKIKEVQSKFRAPFEYINYPSSTKARRASVDSDESFFCVGEGEQRANTQGIHDLKASQYNAANERRLSGAGISPWGNHAPSTCKQCKKFAMVGVQGLCEKCEADFYLRKAQRQNSDSNYEDDLRPTPLLKDAKILFQVETDSLEDVRSTIALKDTGFRPTLNPVPLRQFSRKAQIEDDEDELTQTHRIVERWSTRYEENDAAYAAERDTAPLLRRKEKGLNKTGMRDTNFYNFYDDVLE